MQQSFVISGVLAAMFTIMLLVKKQKTWRDIFLASIFGLVTINCLFVFLFSKHHAVDTSSVSTYYLPWFSELNYAIPLLYGPLLWFYAKSMTKQPFRFGGIDAVHFIPFLAFFVIITVPIYTSYKIPQTSQLGYPLIKLVSAPIYLFLVFQLLREYSDLMTEQYSYTDKVNLSWLFWITTGATILWGIGVVSFIYNMFNEEDKILLYDFYTLGFLAVFLFVLAIVAFTQTRIFASAVDVNVAEYNSPIKASPPLDQPIVTQEDGRQITEDKKLLLVGIEEHQPYLDPALSLSKLSSIIKIPSYRITKVLKEEFDSNFYDFINEFRVNAIKARLQNGDAEQLNLLAIAQDSGFNSKASFNRVFKKITGQTPSQYLKCITISPQSDD